MCGIIGAVGNKEISKDLLVGLYNLEYRGYDSAGIAVQTDDGIVTRKVVGGIKKLDELLEAEPINGICGIGHTRWATHGAPSMENCHPIHNDRVTIVHNGIIENYVLLKNELLQLGWIFKTDTDTEVIAHLMAQYLKDGMQPLESVTKVAERLQGLYAFVAIMKDSPGTIFGYKQGAPLLVGLGQEVLYLGSDAISLSTFVQKVLYLEDGEMVMLTADSHSIYATDGKLINRETKDISATLSTHKGKFQHFMLKEIMEQPQMLAGILCKYAANIDHSISFPNVDIDYNTITSIKLIACGSSYYSACVASYWMEELMPIPVSVDIASEFCYRTQKICFNCLHIFISQSGETADTLFALKRITAEGGKTLSIVNVEESSIARLAQHYILTHAGPEVSVASTKACTAQLMVLALLSLQMATQTKAISKDIAISKTIQLQQASDAVYEVLVNGDKLDDMVKVISMAERVLYIGRGDTYPIALEGALKLREISYITAMGVAAGELKHGTIALVDGFTPTVVLAPYNSLFSKTAGSTQGIHARGGPIQLLSNKNGTEELAAISDNVFILPQVESFVIPMIYSVAMQLIAYKVGLIKELNVDKPRNLAKSVTVE